MTAPEKLSENGYGFHLHGEKGKNGQFIRKVEPASSAEASGKIRTKDTHHQVVQRIKAVEHETRLLVVDRETDEYLRSLRLVCTEEMAVRLGGPTSVLYEGRPNWKHLLFSTSHILDPSELFPRLCHLVRAETGYGFNLHSEKSRPGQYIRSLDPGSPADHAGLRPQDRLIEVNGVNVEGMRHAEVVAFVKRGGDETRLLVVDPDTDHHFKKMGVTPLASHVKGRPTPLFICKTEYLFQVYSYKPCQRLGGDREDEASRLMDPFAEIGLLLSPTAAEAKEKAHAKRAKKRAPQMDWDKNTKRRHLFLDLESRKAP
uniref:PDZ domain-containing protein n=1 Tax=Oncorhynchus tshawytscha TaxID=74940 RepID=A0A8C8IA89_ONCTS